MNSCLLITQVVSNVYSVWRRADGADADAELRGWRQAMPIRPRREPGTGKTVAGTTHCGRNGGKLRYRASDNEIRHIIWHMTIF